MSADYCPAGQSLRSFAERKKFRAIIFGIRALGLWRQFKHAAVSCIAGECDRVVIPKYGVVPAGNRVMNRIYRDLPDRNSVVKPNHSDVNRRDNIVPPDDNAVTARDNAVKRGNSDVPARDSDVKSKNMELK